MSGRLGDARVVGDGEAVKVGVLCLEHGRGIRQPAAASPASAGFDLRAAVGEPLLLPPGGRARVPTGIALEIPCGWEGQVRPRSGLALEHGVTLLNAPGTIDADYRGEIGVILVNLGADEFLVRRGDRIAQIVFAKVEPVVLEARNELGSTSRGASGFGSTGRR